MAISWDTPDTSAPGGETPGAQPTGINWGASPAPVAPPMAATNAPSSSDSIWSGLTSVARGAGNILGGNAIGQDIGTLAGFGLSKANDLISKGANKLGSPVKPTNMADNYDLSAPSPLQAVGDTAKIGATVGSLAVAAPETVGAAALQGGAFGALAGGGQAAVQSNDLKKTAEGAALGGVLGAGTGALVQGFSNLLSKAGNKITESVIKPSAADVKDGFSMETIHKNNLGGSLPVMLDKTESKLNDLTAQLNERLAGSDATINMNDVYNATANSMSGGKLKSFGSNTSVQGALSQLKDEIGVVGGDTGQLSIPDSQVVKQSAGKFGAWQYGKIDPESTAREQVYNTFYHELKTAIEKNSPPGVEDINRQISELIPVSNAIVRRIPVAARNNILSLSDIVSLGASAINPHALGVTMLNLASKSGAAGDLLSRFAPRLGAIATPAASLAGEATGATVGTQ